MKVFIIGNGFDLDLGLKTRYSDFAKSQEWNKLYALNKWSEGSMAIYLKNQAEKENWFDIEQCIADYVHKKEYDSDFTFVDEDRAYFMTLKDYLDNYLTSCLLDWEPHTDSLASELIKMSNNGESFDAIYCFNYTSYDMNDTLTSNIPNLYNVKYVHNQGARLVLGINEDGISCREYSFVKKVNHSFYPSTNIIPDLDKATQVIIFGHSLNKIDWVYFKNFFLQSSETISEPKRIITIVSKDQSSLLQIKNNLNDFGISLTSLRSLCQLEFIGTDDYEFDTYDTREKVGKMFKSLNDIP
jgi:hypothetical protein